MSDTSIVWLASYPRSGNTFLRTVLWQCFGLRSASIYPSDLGGKTKLEEYVGHIEHGPDGMIRFPENQPMLVKTHEHAKDDARAIYIVRDGRAAAVSLWEFYNRTLPLEAVIAGQHRFGLWADHVKSWQPWQRPNTLFLRYETLAGNLQNVLGDIGAFLGRDVLRENIPDRNTIANDDGRWVRKKTTWESELYGENLDRFNRLNEEMLKKCGYLL